MDFDNWRTRTPNMVEIYFDPLDVGEVGYECGIDDCGKLAIGKYCERSDWNVKVKYLCDDHENVQGL